MKATVILLFAGVVFCAPVLAEDPAITKIVARVDILGVAGTPIPTKPRTMYIAGDKYARVEEGVDVAAGTQKLIVTNEPDIWLIDLVSKTGRHMLDPGPKFVTQAPIFWTTSGQPEPDFEDLEFGREMKFFGGGRARELKPRTLEEKKCQPLSIKTGPHETILFLDPKTGKPFQIDLIKFDRLVASVRYVSYETDLPFDAALFQPPPDIKITE